MTEKVAQAGKQISAKIATAACAASCSLGASDALLLLGVCCILASAWITSHRKFPPEWTRLGQT